MDIGIVRLKKYRNSSINLPHNSRIINKYKFYHKVDIFVIENDQNKFDEFDVKCLGIWEYNQRHFLLPRLHSVPFCDKVNAIIINLE